jgi:hypothetical protein
MAGRVWTAEELERMSPTEQEAVFAQSVITDLHQVPPEFLARVRSHLQDRMADDLEKPLSADEQRWLDTELE